jgi:hypothetical protein
VGPLVSDDFFRLAHDDVSGKPLLHPVALANGLAAGLLMIWFGLVMWTFVVRCGWCRGGVNRRRGIVFGEGDQAEVV